MGVLGFAWCFTGLLGGIMIAYLSLPRKQQRRIYEWIQQLSEN